MSVYIKIHDGYFMSKKQFKTRERENFLEVFKIQVDDIILPWVADGISMYWWIPMS